MVEEVVLESFPESDEAEDWESDEAFDESEDSFEDIGERSARQRRRARARARSRFRPGRGVRGMTVRDADGRARNVAFPAKLATADETNRGLATQEVARRALEQRLDRLESRGMQQQKNGSAISGIVTLLIGGGLTAFSLFKASQSTSTGSTFSKWAQEDMAKVATLTSVGQIAGSGAKLLVNGRYHRSGIGMAADAFAAAQVAGFALASLSPPEPESRFVQARNDDERKNAAALGAIEGDRVYQVDTDKLYVLRKDSRGALIAIPL
jgi:hypothetical protein